MTGKLCGPGFVCGNGIITFSWNHFRRCFRIWRWLKFSLVTLSPRARWTAKAIAEHHSPTSPLCCCMYGTSTNKVGGSNSPPSSSSLLTDSLYIKASWWVRDELSGPPENLLSYYSRLPNGQRADGSGYPRAGVAWNQLVSERRVDCRPLRRGDCFFSDCWASCSVVP